AGYALLFEPGEQVMTPEVGYILTDLLRNVVKQGTGAAAMRLGKPAAGKTGTTNDSFDAWFAGFTRDLVTVSWVGYDLNPHPISRSYKGLGMILTSPITAFIRLGKTKTEWPRRMALPIR